ncbi:MAG TPA: TetR/AcrR family transcriptional regulator [Candidatus Micrarchaeaceae archaeon]|nr:TetR/AcrR family transcriptional regulator [Candidatus Micrarchaeaceae archaeon]
MHSLRAGSASGLNSARLSPIVLSANGHGKKRVRRGRPLMVPPLTRREAKERTRKRLIEAARELILSGDETRVAASTVAKRARVAGATFYEHFRSRDELLKALADELFDELREKLAKSRREALAAPGSEEKLRQEFQTPLDVLASNPDLFRLSLRVRHYPASPLGDSSRRLSGNTRRDLVEELMARGYPHDGPAELRRLEMIADVHIAATEVLALGYLSGRYPDLDEVVDMLVLVTHGTRLAREWRGRTAPGPEVDAVQVGTY